MKTFFKLSAILAVVIMSISFSGQSQNAWINEFHYDDYGTDTNEFIEVAIQDAGSYNLADFGVVLYNGNNGGEYSTVTLDEFTEGETLNTFTLFYRFYETNGIQNGEADGMALVYNEEVIYGQFLSWEGTFTAVDGPASGMTSVDIGVQEAGEEEGLSLQLSGTGSTYVEFTWQPPDYETHGQLNNGQSFIQVGIGEPAAFAPVIFPNPNDGQFSINNVYAEDLTVTVYSLSGKQVSERQPANGQRQTATGKRFISTESLPAGTYIVRFSDSGGKFLSAEKMIVR